MLEPELVQDLGQFKIIDIDITLLSNKNGKIDLVHYGAKPNTHSIRDAIEFNHTELVPLLIEYGEDI